MYFISLLSLLSLAIAAPTSIHDTPSRVEKRFAESTPWILSDVKVFEAKAKSNLNSTISFHFCDVNTGLKMDTECSRSAHTIVDSANYYFCNNNTVQFIFSGDNIQIARLYTDPSLGPPPYDTAQAFGDADLDFTNTTTTTGTKSTQAEVHVPITSLAG